MIISLAVILVPCALIYAFFSQVPDAPQVPAADWRPVVAQARGEARYPVLAPTNLPDGWKPVRARWADQRLELGWLSPDVVYHEVKQAPGERNASFVRDVTRGGRTDGTSTVAGRTWTRTVTGDERTRCLVSTTGGAGASTTVVCADAPYQAVEAFAGTLA